MRPVLATATVAMCAAAAPVASADSRPVRPLGQPGPLGTERLSDERRVTRHAGPVKRAPVRAEPHGGARRIDRLHYLQEDGPLEIYPVLASEVDSFERVWLRIRLPGRPNGRTGWVRREHLGRLSAVRTMLRVNRRTLRAVLRRDGRRIWSSRIGVGAASTPTPLGRFWVRSRLRVPEGNPQYGPYAFGTGAYSVLSDWPGGGVIGIHGTDAPWLIPGRPSHGCIRVPNARIARLWRLMPAGTPVAIVR